MLVHFSKLAHVASCFFWLSNTYGPDLTKEPITEDTCMHRFGRDPIRPWGDTLPLSLLKLLDQMLLSNVFNVEELTCNEIFVSTGETDSSARLMLELEPSRGVWS